MRFTVSETVEEQSSCTVIHIQSYSRADGRYKISPFVIVKEWVTGGETEQTPGLIMSKQHSFPNPCLLMLLYDTDTDHNLHSTQSPSNSIQFCVGRLHFCSI